MSDSRGGFGALGLAGGSAREAAPVARPRFRWSTRVVLPGAIVLTALGLFVYAARDALIPAIDVEVVPVIAKPRALPAEGGEAPARAVSPTVVAQAPGWVEPAPFAITVQALIPGVVEDVHVLEGERVEAGDVLVTLIDDEERLAAERSRAELEERQAALERARLAVATAEARHAELQDEVSRKRGLVGGGVSIGEFARMELRLKALAGEVELARAEVSQADAAVRAHLVQCDQADLALARTVIRAPISGVVLERSVEPGSRVGMPGVAGEGMTGLLRLYDPQQLQVRADVPLADAGKVDVGTIAEITTEAAPDQVFRGVIERMVHEADIQRNTVQAKIRIENPSPILKPEMLTRVRLLSGSGGPVTGAPGEEMASGTLRLLAAEDAIVDRDGDRAAVWIAQPRQRARGHVAIRREVTLGPADGEYIEVFSGVQPGDRLIVDPPAELAEGTRVEIVGEVPRAAQARRGSDHGVH